MLGLNSICVSKRGLSYSRVCSYNLKMSRVRNRKSHAYIFTVNQWSFPEDQTGYVKKRFIGNNIRIIEDIMIYTTKKKISGIILSVDFEKAFDPFSWKFLAKCLEAFNFGPKFRSYVQTLYHDISATVLNNGHTSQWFRLERGVRQGCPLSPYLFILLAETLSCKIRENEAIKGISLNDCEINIT